LDDVLLGEYLHISFAVFVTLRQGDPADRESAEGHRQQCASHDRSSDGTEAISPVRNKDDGGGVVCDRADENSEKSETGSGAVRRAGLPARAPRIGSTRPGRSRFASPGSSPSAKARFGFDESLCPWGG